MSEMRDLSKHLREFYVALIMEGFSAGEALTIVMTAVTAGIKAPVEKDDK